MTSGTRQQLYDRIRETSKDEVILEEMIRYGFWPAGSDRPNLPEELIRRRGELQREISDLASQSRRYANPEQAIKEIMTERMRLARERRVETKRRQAQQRHHKAKTWADRRRDDIVHLGDTGSKALAGRESDVARLEANDLPVFDDMKAIANAMGVAIGELRFLAYDRKAARTTHYKRFQIAKKTGGMRTVSAPMPRLKRAQYWLLDKVLGKLEPHGPLDHEQRRAAHQQSRGHQSGPQGFLSQYRVQSREGSVQGLRVRRGTGGGVCLAGHGSRSHDAAARR